MPAKVNQLMKTIDEHLNVINRNMSKLKHSQMLNIQEFLDMYLATEHHYKEAKLSRLTGKGPDVISRMIQNSHFFTVLTRMMLDVTDRTDDESVQKSLKKVHAWFESNRSKQPAKPEFKARHKITSPNIMKVKLKTHDQTTEKESVQVKEVIFPSQRIARMITDDLNAEVLNEDDDVDSQLNLSVSLSLDSERSDRPGLNVESLPIPPLPPKEAQKEVKTEQVNVTRTIPNKENAVKEDLKPAVYPLSSCVTPFANYSNQIPVMTAQEKTPRYDFSSYKPPSFSLTGGHTMKIWDEHLEKGLKYKTAKDELGEKVDMRELVEKKTIVQHATVLSSETPRGDPEPGSAVIKCSTEEFLNMSNQYYPVKVEADLRSKSASARLPRSGSGRRPVQVDQVVGALDNVSSEMRQTQSAALSGTRFDDGDDPHAPLITQGSGTSPGVDCTADFFAHVQGLRRAVTSDSPQTYHSEFVDWRGRITPEAPSLSSGRWTKPVANHSYVKKLSAQQRRTLTTKSSPGLRQMSAKGGPASEKRGSDDIAKMMQVTHLGGTAKDPWRRFYFPKRRWIPVRKVEGPIRLLEDEEIPVEFVSFTQPAPAQRSITFAEYSHEMWTPRESTDQGIAYMDQTIREPGRLFSPDAMYWDRRMYGEEIHDDPIMYRAHVTPVPVETDAGTGPSRPLSSVSTKQRPVSMEDWVRRTVQRSAPSMPYTRRVDQVTPTPTKPQKFQLPKRRQSGSPVRVNQPHALAAAGSPRLASVEDDALSVVGQSMDVPNKLQEEKSWLQETQQRVQGVSRPDPLPNAPKSPFIARAKFMRTANAAAGIQKDNSKLAGRRGQAPIGSRPIPEERVVKDPIVLQREADILREASASVDIPKIFRGNVSQDYVLRLRKENRESEECAQIAALIIQRSYRKHRTRCTAIERRPPNQESIQWAHHYKRILKDKKAHRNAKLTDEKREIARQSWHEAQKLSIIGPHLEVYQNFHPPRADATARERHCAAVTIQRHVRGWSSRRLLDQLRRKACYQAADFALFLREYYTLMKRIQRRAGVRPPQVRFSLFEMTEYIDKKRVYEVAFDTKAFRGVLLEKEIMHFFKECGLAPSRAEVDDAMDLLYRSQPDRINYDLAKNEAIELVFQVYKPRGTGLHNTRKSTWMHPIVDGQDAIQLVDPSELEPTPLSACLKLVLESQRDRMDFDQRKAANRAIRLLQNQENDKKEEASASTTKK